MRFIKNESDNHLFDLYTPSTGPVGGFRGKLLMMRPFLFRHQLLLPEKMPGISPTCLTLLSFLLLLILTPRHHSVSLFRHCRDSVRGGTWK